MPVFGAPLREACRDGCGGVPRVVAETIAWLDAHVAVKPVPGLHRVPGDTRVVAECASRYDEREAAPLRGVRDARAVASVLKLYLDALPTPLLRAAPGQDVAAAGPATVAAVAETRRERGHDAALAALRAFVSNRLPVCNRDALRATCAHLRRVAQAEAAAAKLCENETQKEFLAAQKEATKALAAAFGKTLCGESLSSVKAGAVVEMLLEHHEFVFGTQKEGFKTTTAAATAATRSSSGEKENVFPVADAVSPKASAFEASRTASRDADDAEKGDVSYVDGSMLDVVRGFFFDGDDAICAEADRALGGSLCSLYADSSGRGECLESASVEWLQREKTAIKRRLRAFDVSVERSSGMKSTKEDKKHLRPLYLRLARVKRRMQIVNAEGEA